MLSPAEMHWDQPEAVGDVPTPRSGHSLTVVRPGIAYMFGGVTKKAKGPVSEVYKLDFTDKARPKWELVPGGKMQPNARWHHSATFDGRDTIVVFGGYSSDFR